MQIRKPDYYDKFHCLASACPDSCCKEWTVQVDADSAARYRELTGSMGEALRQVMVEEDGDLVLALTPEKRCPMWRDDGLCHIQAELGEAYLCHTCRDFPRLRHDYGDFIELGLELSCPEAARLILAGNSSEITLELPGEIAPEYDVEAMSILLRSRQELLSFLSNTTMPIGHTLAITLLYGYAVQEELDGGKRAVLDPNVMLKEARSLATPGNMHAILDFYQQLEILTPQWQNRLNSISPTSWVPQFRPLVQYFLSRYWLQAVSDYDLISRTKLTVISCLVIKALGGDFPETAQLYSKEVENDPDNMDSILDGAYTAPAFADNGLLGLLLED